MIALFLGLTAVNLLLMAVVFCLGFGTLDLHHQPTTLYTAHQVLGIMSALACALVHTAVFTYFMATTKWLGAATDKAGLEPQQFTAPALVRKGRAFRYAMAAIGVTILAMIAGAGADPTVKPLWPSEVHLALAGAALLVNFACAAGQYKLIARQCKLIDRAAAILGHLPGVEVEKG